MTDMVTIEWPDNQPPSSDAEFWKQYLTEDETAPAVKEIIMPKQFKAIKLNVLVEGAKGGPGSGNRGHRGRPGHLGGSVGGSGAGGSGASMSEADIIKETKSGLAGMRDNVNQWSVRDTLMNASNDFLGTDYMSLGGEEGTKTAKSIATKLQGLDKPEMLRLYDKHGEAISTWAKHPAKPTSEPATSPISQAQSKAEDAAFKRLTAKLDATQNFSGKPKSAANTITATARPSIKGNGTSTINRSDIKVGAVITGGNLDGYKIHTVTKFPNGSMRVVLMDEAGHIKGSLVPPKSTVAVIK